MTRPSLAPVFDPRSRLIITSQREISTPAVPTALGHRTTHLRLEETNDWPEALQGLATGERPDLAQVFVPPEDLLRTLAYLERWRPRALILHGLPPIPLPFDLQEWARQHDCCLLGPHSFGVQRPVNGLNASLAKALAPKGRVALIAQSHALMAALLDWAEDTRTGLSAVIALGETPTIGIDQLLDFFAFDGHTDSIVLYLDDTGAARPFMSALRSAARVKPVVVLKAGRRAPAAPGISATPDAVFDAALRRAGALRVHYFVQLFSALKTLGQRSRPRGTRLALITNGGGPVDLVLDSLATQEAIRLANLAEPTRQQLKALLSPYATTSNPVMEPASWSAPAFRQALNWVLDDPNVDALLVVLTPEYSDRLETLVDVLIEVVPQQRKPVVTCLMGDASVRRLRRRLADAGLAAFRTPETAADSFGQLVRFYANQQLLLQTQPKQRATSEPAVNRWRPQLQAALADGQTTLSGETTRALLADYGVTLYEGPPLEGGIITARIQIFRDATFGAVLQLLPAGHWPAGSSNSLELLPLNAFLVRHLLERNPLWKLAFASDITPPVLNQFEQQLLGLAELAVNHPEIAQITLDPVLLTDQHSAVLQADLVLISTPDSLAGPMNAPHLAIAPYPWRWQQRQRFADGSAWELRAIRPDDAESLQKFIQDLSTESRYMRFVSSLRELPASLLARYTQIDYDREVALIATVTQANPEHRNYPQEVIVGLAHYLRNPDGISAEFALVVADAWQRRGLGPTLMRALCDTAREQGLELLDGHVLTTNQAMLGLMKHLGFRNEPAPDDPTMRRVWLSLTQATP